MKKRIDNYIIIVLVIIVTINLFLFSSISPLHSINNMQYDEWIFYLIGKGMVHGKVPYHDLMDHKGPYLFYLFALMNLFPRNHIGLFIVSTIIYVFIAIFTYKIAYLILMTGRVEHTYDRNYRSEHYELVFVALIVHLFLSSYYISFGTITSEIITLPFTLSSYYLFLKYLYSKVHTHPLKYMFQYGLCAGIVFFIKANAVLTYLPIAIYLLIFLSKKKEYVNLIKNAVVGFSTFIAALVPAIIYSLITGSLKDMIEGAFVINFLYTGRGLPGSSTVAESLYDTVMIFKEFSILCVLSVFAFCYFNSSDDQNHISEHYEPTHEASKSLLHFYILSLIINLYSVYMACRPYTNYLAYLIFYFIPFALLFIHGLCTIIYEIWKRKIIYVILAVTFVICINILSYGLVYEQSSINGSNQKAFSRRVIDIYNNSESYKPRPELLVIGRPLFLYEAFDSVPNEKYFATPVISRKIYSEPYDAIIHRINDNTEDVVVVSFNDTMNHDKEFMDLVYDALSENYVSIGETKYLNNRAEIFVKQDGK